MSDSEGESNPTIAEDVVVTKCKMASEIVTATLSHLCKACVDGAKVLTLCEMGDTMILEETAKVFKKEKDMKKGIAFPTCISVNNIICYYSPLRSDTNAMVLKDGDVVKINLGAHIDGLPVVGGHTIVIGASPDNKITGRKADVILAAHHIAEACLRLMKPGTQNYKVTEIGNKIADEFKCKPVEGTQCHRMSRNKFNDEKVIVWNPSEDQRRSVEKCQIEKYEVWNVTVTVSTGEGRPKETDTRTTIFRKSDLMYQLKMKTSRQFFHDITSKFQSFPFTIRAWEDEKLARAGVIECKKHDLVESMNVYQEREGEYVAMFQYTLLVMPNNVMRIGGLPFDTTPYQSTYKVESPELKELLNSTSVGGKKKKKNKKKGDDKEEETNGKDSSVKPDSGSVSVPIVA
jgi:curved DNA binding protein